MATLELRLSLETEEAHGHTSPALSTGNRAWHMATLHLRLSLKEAMINKGCCEVSFSMRVGELCYRFRSFPLPQAMSSSRCGRRTLECEARATDRRA